MVLGSFIIIQNAKYFLNNLQEAEYVLKLSSLISMNNVWQSFKQFLILGRLQIYERIMFHFQAEHLEDKTETEGGSRGRMHHLLVSRTILRKKCISYFEKISDFESLYRFLEAISLLASWCIQSNGLQMNYWSYDVTFLHSNSVDHCTAFQI